MPVTRTAGVAVVDAGSVALTEPRPLAPPVPPTDPVPPPSAPSRGHVRAPATRPSRSPVAIPAPARAAAPRSLLRRLASAGRNRGARRDRRDRRCGVALRGAVPRHGIPAIDERTVICQPRRVRRRRAAGRCSTSVCGLRVNGSLLSALRTIGDRVIADYRREVPTMGPEEWRQAQAAFGWARVLSPRDGSLLAKQLTADGHVRRLAAQRTRPAEQRHGAERRGAGFAMPPPPIPTAFDPYVGMAVTQLYMLADVDGAIQSLEAAVKRGYTVTRRDTALLGDANLRRGMLGREARGAPDRRPAADRAREGEGGLRELRRVVRADRGVRQRRQTSRDLQGAAPPDHRAAEPGRRVLAHACSSPPTDFRRAPRDAHTRALNIELLGLAAASIIVLFGIVAHLRRQDRCAAELAASESVDPAARA